MATEDEEEGAGGKGQVLEELEAPLEELEPLEVPLVQEARLHQDHRLWPM